jgi:hypothetical protein
MAPETSKRVGDGGERVFKEVQKSVINCTTAGRTRTATNSGDNNRSINQG